MFATTTAHFRWDSAPPARALGRRAASLLPGILLCRAVSIMAMVFEHAERMVWQRAWLEALVLAILLGTALRSVWTPGRRFGAGIDISARLLLEVAVGMLGASVGLRALIAAGPWLLAGVAGVVVMAIGASYAIGRLLGLPHLMITLIACGNSICGNSAIAAVAPVIGASGEDVAASIACTAVLGGDRGAAASAEHRAAPSLHPAIRRPGGAYRLCGAASARRRSPRWRFGGAVRHHGQARARADA